MDPDMLEPSITTAAPPLTGTVPQVRQPAVKRERDMPPLRLVPYFCLGLILLADVFFYQAPRLDQWGWIIAGFAGALLLSVAAANPRLLSSRIGQILVVLDAGLCLAMVEQPSTLALLLFSAGLASFILAHEATLFAGPLRWAFNVIAGGMFALIRVTDDATHIVRQLLGMVGLGGVAGLVSRWALPVGFAIVFIGLFAGANPLLNSWLTAINWHNLWAQIPNLDRLFFWSFVAGITWTALRAPLTKLGLGALFNDATASIIVSKGAADEANGLISRVFSTGAVIRSMVLFNLLFAVQNTMDVVFLWGGRALPAGQTYASSAHASAYPLIVTALIAAAFVLIAFRDGSETGSHRLSKPLMYLWVAQNIALVASAVWRTWAYVGEYSLTYLRLFALIWMGLVAAGLLLVIARFATRRSNGWLLNANILSLISVLYISSFLNFGGMIADYNVASCKPIVGCDSRLDAGYLADIGQPALPALKRAALVNDNLYVRRHNGATVHSLSTEIVKLEDEIRAANRRENWRSWTYLRHRLNRQIGNQQN
jgi:Domain of unknown function (DUF4173)